VDIKNKDILVIGQLRTSRTETVEDYLLNQKIRSLGVIGVMSPFATYNESRATLYDNANKIKEFPLSCFSIKKVRWWNRPLMCISFLTYIFSILTAVRKLDRKYDLVIGIATFSSMLGIFLKKIGIVKQVIYYCLDYYPPPTKLCFNSFVNFVYKHIDAWLVKKADFVWEISPRIKEGRKKFMNVDPFSYQTIIVPLGYDNTINKNYAFEQRQRWTIGFVGTLSDNQGLQMVAKAMPELAKKFPEIRVSIVGHGPYAGELKSLIKDLGVENRFIFHGFVKEEEKVHEILSRTMLGLATWTGDETDNSIYADPGKPKLYALLGLPVIITKAPYISKQIQELKAGEVIDYDEKQFIAAVEKIISDKSGFERYREGLEKFVPLCRAECIFDQAFKEMEQLKVNS